MAKNTYKSNTFKTDKEKKEKSTGDNKKSTSAAESQHTTDDDHKKKLDRDKEKKRKRVLDKVLGSNAKAYLSAKASELEQQQANTSQESRTHA